MSLGPKGFISDNGGSVSKGDGDGEDEADPFEVFRQVNLHSKQDCCRCNGHS